MNLPDKKYKIIYADLPLQYDDKALAGNRGASCKYDTMTTEDLCKLPIQKIADNDCFLFIWATWPMIQDVFQVIKAWGFIYKTLAFNWIKTNQNGTFFQGMGSFVRGNSEPCLLATKGHPKVISHSISQIVKTTYNGIHSKKPDIVRQRILELCGNLPRIELFGRVRAVGWDVIGDDPKLELKPLERFSFK